MGSPEGLWAGPGTEFYLVDSRNHRVRKVDPYGFMRTVAGTGASGSGGDGGPALAAQLHRPKAIALGPDGDLYIAETDSHRIRRVGLDLVGSTGNEITIASYNGLELYVFSPAGRHLRTIDAVTGRDVYAFRYDTAGLLIEVQDRDGNTTRIERDGSRTPKAIVAAHGQRTGLGLDAKGYLASVSNPAGQTYNMAYSSTGLLSAFTDQNGHTNRFEYDGLGRLVHDTDAGGGGWTLARSKNPGGYTTTLTSGEGRTTTFEVETLPTGDRLQTRTSADGTVARILFKNNGEEITTAPDGTVRTIREGPDPRFGMLSPVPVSVTVQTPSGLTGTTTTFRTVGLTNPRDPLSLTMLTETTTVNGNSYRSIFDPATKDYARTTPAGRASSLVVDANHRPMTSQTAGLEPVHASYDERGRLVRVTAGAESEERTLTLGYYPSGPAQGYLQVMVDPLGRTVTYDYDLTGRVTKKTLPDGRAVQYEYDANGNLVALYPPGQPPHFFSYTALDQEAEYTPPDLGQGDPATRYHYNRDKQLTRILRPDGAGLEFAYDGGGRLERLTTPLGNYRYTYSPETGQLETLMAPDGGMLSYGHDGFLNTGTTWDGEVKGEVARLYDNDFRLIALTVTGEGGEDDTIPFGYDPDGLLTAAGDLRLQRHPEHGLIEATTLVGAVRLDTASTYNGFGEIETHRAEALVSATNPESVIAEIDTHVGMIRDIVGSAFEIYPADLIDAAAGLPLTVSEVRSALAALEARIVRSFGQHHPALAEFRPEAAAINKLLTQLDTNDGGISTTLYEASYGRDVLGRITEKSETLNGITTTHNYTYDLTGRLAEVQKDGVVISTYGYDENGNRTHVNGVAIGHYDTQDRLLDYAGTTYTYTPNGELASKTAGAHTTTYEYDVLGNLRSVALPDGSCIEYLIDGQNRRIGKKVNGTLVQGILYQDQLRPIAELDGHNNVVSRFVYADKSNVPAYMVKAGVAYRIISDHLGSPRLVVNADTGDIAQRLDYDEWGRVTLDTNPGFQPFGFAGGLYDRDTKLVRFGARDYDPETGRWTAKDPIRFAGANTNLYGYVMNDPINWIDSLGLAQEDVDRANDILNSLHPDFYNRDVDVSFGDTPGDFGRTDYWTGDVVLSREFAGPLNSDQRIKLIETLAHEYQHSNESILERSLTNFEDMLDGVPGVDIDGTHDNIGRNSLNLDPRAYDRMTKPGGCP